MRQAEAFAGTWWKSSRCDSGQCVEVAWHTNGVAVRDSTLADVHLAFDRASWRGLLHDLKGGVHTR